MFRRTPLRPCPLLGLWLVFFVNGAVLSSWAPRIPEVKDRLALAIVLASSWPGLRARLARKPKTSGDPR